VRALGGDWSAAQLLVGGPPCQSFSNSGNREGLRELENVLDAIRTFDFTREFADERTGMVLQPLRWIVERLMVERPFEFIALEQVPTVLPVWQEYAKVLKGLGYRSATGILNAQDFGVPQDRSRAVYLGSLNGYPALPMPTHFEPVGFAQALGLYGDWTLVSNNTSQAHRDRRSVRHNPAPSFTLTGRCCRMHVVPGHIEPPRSMVGLGGRNITIVEAGILQGFPREFAWVGSKDDVQQQIGNAIPPPMAEAMIKAVTEVW
jgi:DNA (cytosine-5)-methyltransferase 1